MNHLKWVSPILVGFMIGPIANGTPPGAARAGADRPERGDARWSRASLWDDGRAEVSTYVGTTRRYGQDRPTRARIIVVKEDLLRATLVKSDDGPVPGRTVEVLKFVFVADFPTGTYAYHQTANLFFERRTLDLLKETMSHSESCGITFVRIAGDRGRWTHEAHSYWEGEADRRVAIDWPRDNRPRLLWDALPIWLRSLPRSRTEAIPVWLLPSQISGRSPLAATRPTAAKVLASSGRPETVGVPFGRVATFRYVVESPAGRDTFWLAAATPHALVRMRSASGRRLDLEKTQRLDYWNHHAVGDERLLE